MNNGYRSNQNKATKQKVISIFIRDDFSEAELIFSPIDHQRPLGMDIDGSHEFK
jgi:hypothetical protein